MYVDPDSIVVAPSAFRHDIEIDQILHALRNPIHVHELDEDMTMIVGADQTGALIEVGFVAAEEGTAVIHAMPARDKFLR